MPLSHFEFESYFTEEQRLGQLRNWMGVVCYFQWELRLVLSFIVYSIAYSSVFCLTVDSMI